MIINTTLNRSNIIAERLGIDDEGKATRFLRDEIDRLSDPYIPMNSGALKNTKTYPDNHSIKYTSPYAQYMYYGILMLSTSGSSWAKMGEKKHVTEIPLNYQGVPKRGAKWDKRMWSDKGQSITKDLENFIRQGG